MKPRLLSAARLSLPLASAIAALLAAATAFATDTATTAWSGTTADWNTGTNWAGGAPSTTLSALFNAAFTNQLQLSANGTAQGIWVTGASAYNGGTVTITGLTSAKTLNITGTATLNSQTNAGVLLDGAGNENLTIGDWLIVALTNNTGFYVNNAGTLTLNNGGATAQNLALSGHTLTLGGTNASGNIIIAKNTAADAGSLIINTAGTVTLSGTNSLHTGGTTLTAGTLNINGVKALGAVGSTFTISGGTTIDNTSNAAIINGVANPITIGGNFAFTGGTGATHDLNLGTGAVALGGLTRTITANAGTLTLGGIVSNGGLIKDGAGTLLLSGANNFTGGVSIAAGTFKLGATTLSLGTAASAVSVTGGAVLDVNGKAFTTLNALTLNGSGIGGTGALIDGISTAGSYAGAVNLASASTIGNAGTALFTVGGTVTSTGTADLTLKAAVTGGITLTNVNNTGTVTNSGAGGGTATITTLGSNVTGLTEAGASPLTVTNAVALTASLNSFTNSGTGLLTLTGQVTGAQNLTLTANSTGGITLTNGSNNSGSILNNGTGTNTVTVGAIGANVTTGVTQNSSTGTSTLSLSAANTYTGGTTITSGTLKIGNAASLGASGNAVSVASGGALDLNGQNVANTNALTLNGTGVSGGGALTNSSGTAATYAGLVTLGSSGVVIGGTGLITLSNAGTIQGTSTGFNLTLQGAGGTVTGIINGGSGGVAGAGSVTINSTGPWTLSAANTFTGGVTIKAGTVKNGNAGSFGVNTGTTHISLGDTGGGSAAVVFSPQLGSTTLNNPIDVVSTNAAQTVTLDNGVSANTTYAGLITLNSHDLYTSTAGAFMYITGGITGTGNLFLNTNNSNTTLTISGTQINNVGNITINTQNPTQNGLTISAPVNNTGTLTNISSGNMPVTISGAIGSTVTGITQNSSTSAMAITKAQAFGGSVAVTAGTLTIGFTGNTGNNTATTLTLGGGNLGGTLAETGKAATNSSQTFSGGTTLNTGASAVTAARGDALATSAMVINLGVITRNVGSTVLFTNPGITLQPLSATNSIQTSSGGNSTASPILDNGIAYATTDLSNWAAKDATGNWVVALTGATDNTTSAMTGNAQIATGIDTTLAAGSSITTLKDNLGEARTITASGQTITTGGILVGSGVTAGNGLTITGGSLKSAASVANKDLTIIQNGAGYLTINSAIVDATAGRTGLTKSGSGYVNLAGTNTYGGPTEINGGYLVFQNTSAKASGTVTANAAGGVAIGVGGSGYTMADFDYLWGNVLTGFSLNTASSVGIDTTAGSQSYAFALTGTRGLGKFGTNTFTLTNAANAYTGATTIGAGTLQIGTAGTLGSGSYAGNITNNGVLQYSSSAPQILSGVISGSGSVVKDTSSTNTLTLSGANTFSGGLYIKAGTASLGAAAGAASGCWPSGVGAATSTASGPLSSAPGNAASPAPGAACAASCWRSCCTQLSPPPHR